MLIYETCYKTGRVSTRDFTVLYHRVFSRLNSRIFTLVWVFECWFCDAQKTVKKKRWSHWHGQDDVGIQETNPRSNEQTNKRAYFTIEFFQDWTLELSHLYEFSSAGFVMREKRLRRKGGVIDTDRMMGGHTQKPRIICSQSVSGSLLQSFPQITTLSYWNNAQF